MAQHKKGQTIICPACKKPYYRPLHNILKNTQKTCSFECNRIMKTGENNPFYGKVHTPETRELISAMVRANPPKGTGPKKGVFKHTDEARRKISEALRERWRTRRADMLAYASQGKNAPHTQFNQEPRFRRIFTREQKQEWIGTECNWCRTTELLVLDHIIPVICGGFNEKTNAQTLCQGCNLWKMRHVDLPLYFALIGSKRG